MTDVVHPFPLVLHPLSPIEACALCAALAAQHIHVCVCATDDAVAVYPLERLTTLEEFTATDAIARCTDQRIAWHWEAA